MTFRPRLPLPSTIFFSCRFSGPIIIELSSVDLPQPVFPMAKVMFPSSSSLKFWNAYSSAVLILVRFSAAYFTESRDSKLIGIWAKLSACSSISLRSNEVKDWIRGCSCSCCWDQVSDSQESMSYKVSWPVDSSSESNLFASSYI